MRRSENRLSALLEHAHDVVAVIGADGRVRFVSSGLHRLLGYDTAATIGADPMELVHPEDRARMGDIEARIRSLGAMSLIDVRVRHADDRYCWYDIDAIDLREQPEVGGIVLSCHEVDSRKALEHELAYRARHDALTGLANRAALAEHLAQLAAQLPAEPFAILFIDLDQFKPVNDTLGHEAGDLVLATMARRLEATIRTVGEERPGDLVYRMGGDEFAILLRDVTENEARVAADRVLEAARRPIPVNDAVVQLGATVGVALSHPAREDPHLAIRRADLAMYEAKESGRDRYALSGSPPDAP